jgi:hypothetical protein
MPYDAEYFARYQQQADTSIGRALTQARVDLVARHYAGPVLDVGIGCGQFVDARPDTTGYDVNPAVVTKLSDRGSTQTVGVVTDVGLFLHRLAEALRG